MPLALRTPQECKWDAGALGEVMLRLDPGDGRIRTARTLRRVLVLLLLSASAAAGQPREPLKIMSFNIRYGTAKDGENHWTARREMVFEVIREQDADLVGLQDALA